MIFKRYILFTCFVLFIIAQTNQQTKTQAQQAEHHQTVKKVKQMLTTMSSEQIKAFQQQLAGQSRQYYQKIKKQIEQHERKQQSEVEILREQAQPQQIQILTEEQIFFNKIFDKQSNQFQKIRQKQHKMNIIYFQLLTNKTQSFQFTPSHTQQITIGAKIYIQNNGVYSVARKWLDQQSDKILFQIESNNRVISHQNFYTLLGTQITMQQNKKYIIYFFNQRSTNKIVQFYYTEIIKSSSVQNKANVQDVADHGLRIQQISANFKQKYQQIHFSTALFQQNLAFLGDKMKAYHIYIVAQLCLIGIICILQVEMIRKLLVPSSIV